MNKKFLFTHGQKNFYDDWTYRCDHWDPDDYSDFRFVEGDMLFLHMYQLTGWQSLASLGPKHEEEVKHIKEKWEKAMVQLLEESLGGDKT